MSKTALFATGILFVLVLCMAIGATLHERWDWPGEASLPSVTVILWAAALGAMEFVPEEVKSRWVT